uniref:Uncharacterized protein SAML0226 n=1 Tax=Streptomyces ambofaciens (strain ATCC 23877 / 3486 / DSM 40053 / JCM 4204 / NBRC 12836 / NRRL B-2516) TaxID=278992 RepID=Q1RRD3_STRA7|nr:unknown [Streptomyces ambofaciens ATCC 23877]
MRPDDLPVPDLVVLHARHPQGLGRARHARGFAYGGGRKHAEGVFLGRKAMVCCTTGTSADTYAPDGIEGDILHLLWPVNKTSTRTCDASASWIAAPRIPTEAAPLSVRLLPSTLHSRASALAHRRSLVSRRCRQPVPSRVNRCGICAPGGWSRALGRGEPLPSDVEVSGNAGRGRQRATTAFPGHPGSCRLLRPGRGGRRRTGRGGWTEGCPRG